MPLHYEHPTGLAHLDVEKPNCIHYQVKHRWRNNKNRIVNLIYDREISKITVENIRNYGQTNVTFYNWVNDQLEIVCRNLSGWGGANE